MALTALEIKDKRFYVKFRGYDAKEVEEFQDMVYRDYEKLVREKHELETKISALEERLNYFEILFMACPTWIFPLAYGGPSCKVK